jgi:hypothetical protein
MVKANAQKDTIVASGPELVDALRQACQKQVAKLEVLPAEPQASGATGATVLGASERASATAPVAPAGPVVAPTPVSVATSPAVENTPREPSPTAPTPARAPSTAFAAGPSAAVVVPGVLESPTAAPTAPPPASQPRLPQPQQRPFCGCCPRPRDPPGPSRVQRPPPPSRRLSRYRPTARA